jgi:hypothetical protein
VTPAPALRPKSAGLSNARPTCRGVRRIDEQIIQDENSFALADENWDRAA